jgi:hypothetical protein
LNQLLDLWAGAEGERIVQETRQCQQWLDQEYAGNTSAVSVANRFTSPYFQYCDTFGLGQSLLENLFSHSTYDRMLQHGSDDIRGYLNAVILFASKLIHPSPKQRYSVHDAKDRFMQEIVREFRVD